MGRGGRVQKLQHVCSSDGVMVESEGRGWDGYDEQCVMSDA
jgi:hypothetical protein